MRAHGFLLCLLALCAHQLVAARRARKEPRGPVPTIGDALEIKANPDYLGKNWQAVHVMSPLSANRRMLKRNGDKFIGTQRRRGLVTWLKKRENFPWERPWDDVSHAPFKVRFLRHDPAGIALSMAQEGKLKLSEGGDARSPSVRVSLPKPKPWYRKFF